MKNILKLIQNLFCKNKIETKIYNDYGTGLIIGEDYYILPENKFNPIELYTLVNIAPTNDNRIILTFRESYRYKHIFYDKDRIIPYNKH
jgi:hypothetical protein